MSPTTFAWLVLALPLAGSIFIGVNYKWLSHRTAGWIASSAVGLAFVATVLATIGVQNRPEDSRQLTSVLWNYAVTGDVDVQVGILVDPLSLLMMLVVTGVGSLIHIYATAYMASDKGYNRFFAYLNFFIFSMLMLVMAGDFVFLIIGWALVGAASYLLISFWYRRTSATRAGIKAFVINVLGDVGLVLGTYFVFQGTGTLDLLQTFSEVDKVFAVNDGTLVAGCLLLLVGAFAKSAQVPLHTWLPDAMEGPTPVSALIHAATMVTAGVYLIGRLHPLFERAPIAADIGAVIGCATLFIAATIALTQTDLKRVIAYSTMSQIGYMIMAVCAGAYAAGFFHLITHAFFKALLFMAAGSVISAMAGIQLIDRMSGFRKAMPFTFICFLVGGLALAGFPPFSGYWSKDEILLHVAERGGWFVALYVVGYIGAFLTAIYTFRMIFRTFYGDPCPEAKELEAGHIHHAEAAINPSTGEVEDTDVGFPGADHHIAERSIPMKVAMGTLAVFATIAGALQIPGVTNVVDNFLEPVFSDSPLYNAPIDVPLEIFGLILGAVISAAGIGVAYWIWRRNPQIAVTLRKKLGPLYELSYNKWYFDEIYAAGIVRPIAWCGRFAQQTFERLVVSGLIVGGTSGIVRAGSAAVRGLQNGLLRYYAALVLAAAAALLIYFLAAS